MEGVICIIPNKPVFQDRSLDNDLDDSLKYSAGGLKLSGLLRAVQMAGWSALKSTLGAQTTWVAMSCFGNRQTMLLIIIGACRLCRFFSLDSAAGVKLLGF